MSWNIIHNQRKVIDDLEAELEKAQAAADKSAEAWANEVGKNSHFEEWLKQAQAENEKLVRTIADRNAELTEVERENRELREFVINLSSGSGHTEDTIEKLREKAQELLKEKG